MPDEKKPILDPEHELPEPHDMLLDPKPENAGELPAGFESQIDAPHTKTGSLDAGYAAQLAPEKGSQTTAPVSPSQNPTSPSFFSRNKFLVFLLPIILLVASAAFATYYVSDAQRKEQMPQPTVPAQLDPTVQPSLVVSPSMKMEVKPTGELSSPSKDAEYAAKIDLARKVGKDIYTIHVISVEEKEWSDSSLGCPQKDMMYMQVITPGYLITLSDGVKEYTYHTDISTKAVSCGK